MMLAVIAFVLFVVAVVVGWLVKSVSLAHLVAIVAAGLAFVALEIGYTWWQGRNRP